MLKCVFFLQKSNMVLYEITRWSNKVMIIEKFIREHMIRIFTLEK